MAALQPFTQGGANPLGADPNAGVPPVDGMQPAGAGDPNAAPLAEAIEQFRAWKKANKGTDKLTEAEMAGLQERFGGKPKTKYEQIKERIAARQNDIKKMQEGFLDIPTTSEMGTLTGKAHTSNSANPDKKTDESPYSSIPSAQSLSKGYTSGKASGETKAAKTWPTKATGKEAGGALQGSGATQTKVKESGPDCDDPNCEEKKLDEGVQTVTDRYVNNYFAPKLDFNALKESMKKGLLG